MVEITQTHIEMEAPL